MGEHLIDGEFQSDKYPDTPRGFVPLKCSDPMTHSLLWVYANRRRHIDPEFADDLQEALHPSIVSRQDLNQGDIARPGSDNVLRFAGDWRR